MFKLDSSYLYENQRQQFDWRHWSTVIRVAQLTLFSQVQITLTVGCHPLSHSSKTFSSHVMTVSWWSVVFKMCGSQFLILVINRSRSLKGFQRFHNNFGHTCRFHMLKKDQNGKKCKTDIGRFNISSIR